MWSPHKGMIPQPAAGAGGVGPGGERPGDPGGARCGVRVALLGELVQALVPRRGGPPVGEPRPGGGGRVVPRGELVQALVPRRGGRLVGELHPGGGGRVVLLGELGPALVPRRGGRPVGELHPGGGGRGDRVVLLGGLVHVLDPRGGVRPVGELGSRWGGQPLGARYPWLLFLRCRRSAGLPRGLVAPAARTALGRSPCNRFCCMAAEVVRGEPAIGAAAAARSARCWLVRRLPFPLSSRQRGAPFPVGHSIPSFEVFGRRILGRFRKIYQKISESSRGHPSSTHNVHPIGGFCTTFCGGDGRDPPPHRSMRRRPSPWPHPGPFRRMRRPLEASSGEESVHPGVAGRVGPDGPPPAGRPSREWRGRRGLPCPGGGSRRLARYVEVGCVMAAVGP